MGYAYRTNVLKMWAKCYVAKLNHSFLKGRGVGGVGVGVGGQECVSHSL